MILKITAIETYELPPDCEIVKHDGGMDVLKFGDEHIDFSITFMKEDKDSDGIVWITNDDIREAFDPYARTMDTKLELIEDDGFDNED